MRKFKKEYILEMSVKHLEWLNYNFGWNQISYPELCEFVYNIYSQELEPLRLEYRAGHASERMHDLLTQGYKYAREVCRDHEITWPPLPIDNIHGRIAEVENKCAAIERDMHQAARQLENLKSEIKLLKKWNRQSN